MSQASVKDTQRLASSPGFKLFTPPCPRDRTIFAGQAVVLPAVWPAVHDGGDYASGGRVVELDTAVAQVRLCRAGSPYRRLRIG